MPSVLVVDDSEEERILYKIFLEKSGCFPAISFAESGTVALAMLGDTEYADEISGRPIDPAVSKPDLILLDINMPGMDGFEVLDRLDEVWSAENKSEVSRPSILMVTGSDSAKDKSRASKTGIVADFVTKPLGFEGARMLAKKFGTVASK